MFIIPVGSKVKQITGFFVIIRCFNAAMMKLHPAQDVK